MLRDHIIFYKRNDGTHHEVEYDYYINNHWQYSITPVIKEKYFVSVAKMLSLILSNCSRHDMEELELNEVDHLTGWWL